MAWVYPSNTTQNTRVYQKGLNPNQQLLSPINGQFSIDDGRGAGGTIARALVNLAAIPAYGANKWVFVAGQTDITTAGNNRMFAGDLTTVAVEATSYVTQSVGVLGAGGNNSGTIAVIGNNSNANVSFVGSIAWVGVWNRILTTQEIQDQQYSPHLTSGCVLFTNLGYNGSATTAPDLSGNGNTGTVTGATFSDDPLLRHNNIQGNSSIQGNSKLY